MPYEIKGVDNGGVAETLLDYVRSVKKEDILLLALDVMLNNKSVEDIQGWDWKIAEIIEWQSSYITVEKDADVDFERGDWGQPIPVGGVERPVDIKVEHPKNLMDLRQEVDDIINQTNDKIIRFIKSKNKPKWMCRGCPRFLGKELSSPEEIQNLLRDFVIGKYWKCRSCKLPNYFVFTDKGIEFQSDGSLTP